MERPTILNRLPFCVRELALNSLISNIVSFLLQSAMMARRQQKRMDFKRMWVRCVPNHVGACRCVPPIRVISHAFCLTICRMKMIGRTSAIAYGLRGKSLARKHLLPIAVQKYSRANRYKAMQKLTIFCARMSKVHFIHAGHAKWAQ